MAFRFGSGLAFRVDVVIMQWLSGLVGFWVRPCNYAVAFRFGFGLAFGLDPVTMQWLSDLAWGWVLG